MRRTAALALLLSVGCGPLPGGGKPQDTGDTADSCFESSRAEVEADQGVLGYAVSDWIASVGGAWSGALQTEGDALDMAGAVTLGDGPILAVVRQSEAGIVCQDWYELTLEVTLDAQDALRLSAAHDAQLSLDGAAFTLVLAGATGSLTEAGALRGTSQLSPTAWTGEIQEDRAGATGTLARWSMTQTPVEQVRLAHPRRRR